MRLDPRDQAITGARQALAESGGTLLASAVGRERWQIENVNLRVERVMGDGVARAD
jgi:hypothetical protein